MLEILVGSRKNLNMTQIALLNEEDTAISFYTKEIIEKYALFYA